MGDKRALCIGINNYPGSEADLSGCVNDANDWNAELIRRGFSTRVMLDGEATCSAIVDGIKGLLASSTGENDLAVITYSGHGTWVPDLDHDEPDGRDEALCPHDYRDSVLLDDDLYVLFRGAPRTARVVFISDSCHSGSLARLAPRLERTGPARQARFLPPSQFLRSTEQLERARLVQHLAATRRPRSTALLLSGCADPQVSWDASFSGRANGAFSRVALDTLQTLKADANYSDWHAAIRKRLPSVDYPQSPQLQGTRLQRAWAVLG